MSLAAATTLAAILVVNVAMVSATGDNTMSNGKWKRPSGATGSQIASPNTSTVALVTKMPMKENTVIVVGSPSSCPSICTRWLFA